MSGIEVLTGNEKLSVMQCQEMAKDIGYDSMEFDLCGPLGKIHCKWVDAYFGMFSKVGEEGIMMIDKNMKFNPTIWCENLTPKTV